MLRFFQTSESLYHFFLYPLFKSFQLSYFWSLFWSLFILNKNFDTVSLHAFRINFVILFHFSFISFVNKVLTFSNLWFKLFHLTNFTLSATQFLFNKAFLITWYFNFNLWIIENWLKLYCSCWLNYVSIVSAQWISIFLFLISLTVKDSIWTYLNLLFFINRVSKRKLRLSYLTKLRFLIPLCQSLSLSFKHKLLKFI